MAVPGFVPPLIHQSLLIESVNRCNLDALSVARQALFDKLKEFVEEKPLFW